MADAQITVDVSIAKIMLAKHTSERLRGRLQYAALQGARVLVPPIRAAAPVGPTGNLQRSVTAWVGRERVGAAADGAGVGPLAPHRHLVIRPHRIVTPGKRDTGRRTTGNPFVDAAVESNKDEAMRVVIETILETP